MTHSISPTISPIAEKAFDTLHQDIMPRLVQLLDEYLPYREKFVAVPPDGFYPLVKETIDLFQLLMQEQGLQISSLSSNDAQSSHDDMSDAEAYALLASMDSPSEPSKKEPHVQVTETQNQQEDTHEEQEEIIEEIPEFSNNEFGADPEMLKDFITNVTELMEVLDEQVLALEQSENSPEIIEEIFRAAHTLKGASGMFGFKAIERIMHRLENYFDQIRKKKRQPTGDGIDVVLSALDLIKKLISAIKNGQPSGEKTAPIVTSLNRLCSGKSTEKQKSEKDISKEKNQDHLDDASDKKNQKKVEQSSIRVDLKRLDALVNLIGELVIDRTRFSSIEEELRIKFSHGGVTSNMSETVQLFGRHMNEIQDIIMKVRMVPIERTHSSTNSLH